MNKIFFLSSLCALAVSITGCSDAPPVNISDKDYITIHFGCAFSHINSDDTRSLAPGYTFSDGSSVSVLRCYLYSRSKGAGAPPVKTVDIDVKTVNGHPGGDFSVQLPRGESYDAVFLGTSIPQDDPSSKLYYSQTDRSLNVNYSSVYANDEELDCFFAVSEAVSTAATAEYDVVLKRPFAQLNIGSKDFPEYNAAHPVSNISVSVSSVYSKVNLMDGSLIGSPSTVTFMGSPVPSGQTFPVSGFSFLSMNYLLVNTRTLVDVEMSVRHADGTTKDISIGDVAVERNYQTNVYGKTLLSD